jgi:acyl-CoA thioesterase-1
MGVIVTLQVHRHFLGGDSTWFTQQIEPSPRASEVRAFLPEVLVVR